MANTHVLRPGSYFSGFAPRDFAPRIPKFWQGTLAAFAPCLGPTGGVLKDWGGGKNDGTLNSFTLGTDWQTFQGRSALSFNGSSAYVSVAHNARLITSLITVGAWVYMTDKTTNTNSVLASKGTLAGDSNSEWALYYNKGLDRFRFFVITSGLALAIVSANTLGSPAVNTWYFVEGKYDGTNITIWVNGKQDTSASAASLRTDGTHTLYIGNDPNNATCFLKGYEDDVFIKDHATTAQESLDRYTAGIGAAFAPSRRMTKYVVASTSNRLLNLRRKASA